jgi:hypothetical protein
MENVVYSTGATQGKVASVNKANSSERTVSNLNIHERPFSFEFSSLIITFIFIRLLI